MVFECGHMFCSDCTLGQLRQLINNAEVDKVKCLEFDCANPVISAEKLKAILSKLEMDGDLWAKYERFGHKKELERDPLVRFCTKPGCEAHMRGKNS